MGDKLIPNDLAAGKGLVPGDLVQEARDVIADALAANTRKAYRSDWKIFVAWCERHRVQALPASPDTVMAFLTDEGRRRKMATIERRLVSISIAHQAKNFETPTKGLQVRKLMQGLRRRLGVEQKQAKPIGLELLKECVRIQPEGPKGDRNRALLLLGFAGAMRRSELVGLDRNDLSFTDEGVLIKLGGRSVEGKTRATKTGGTAAVYLPIPSGQHAETCPVRALKKWLAHLPNGSDGPLFAYVGRYGAQPMRRFTDEGMDMVIKEAVRNTGARNWREFSGHSLRAGFITEAAEREVPDWQIMKQSRHKSHAVFARYIRSARAFKKSAAGKVGL